MTPSVRFNAAASFSMTQAKKAQMIQQAVKNAYQSRSSAPCSSASDFYSLTDSTGRIFMFNGSAGRMARAVMHSQITLKSFIQEKLLKPAETMKALNAILTGLAGVPVKLNPIIQEGI